MLKRAIIRGTHSFAYAIMINVVVYGIAAAIANRPDFTMTLPGFTNRFSSPTQAVMIQFILIGLTSASFGFWSILMETKRLGLLLQSLLYFVLTAIVWLPVSYLCWEITKYPTAFIGVCLSYLFSYVISWSIQYRLMKASVNQINEKLREMRDEL